MRAWHTFEDSFGWALLIVAVGAFLSFFFSFQAGVFALFFAALAWWVWKYPEEGFLLLLVTLPILPMLKITQTIGTVTLLKDVIIGTLFVRQFLVPLCTKQLPYRRNILMAPIMVLGIWTAFEMLRADSLILGVLRARDIGLYALLYLGVLYLPHSPKLMVRRFVWFTGAFLVTGLLSIYQWFYAVDSSVLRFDPVREVWIPRLSSILAHPSIYGEYVVTAGSLFAALIVFARNQKTRLIMAALFIVTLPIIYFTYSRAVWLGFAAAIAAVIGVYLLSVVHARGMSRRVWRYLSYLLIAAVFIAMLMLRFTSAGTFVQSAIDPTYGSNVERLEFLARLIAPMTNTEAMVGRGLGDVLEQNFREVDLEAIDIAEGSARAVQLTKNTTLVDNQYLKTFVEMGLVGLLIYAWLFIRFGKGIYEGIKRNVFETRVVSVFAAGFLVAFVVQGLFIDIWDIFPTNALFWIVGGLLGAVLTPSGFGFGDNVH